MTTIINAKNITLGEVSQFLKFQEQLNNDTYTNFLSLESLTEIEQLELAQIRKIFANTSQWKESLKDWYRL